MNRGEAVGVHQVDADALPNKLVCEAFTESLRVELVVGKQDVQCVGPVRIQDVVVDLLSLNQLESLSESVLQYAQVERTSVLGSHDVEVHFGVQIHQVINDLLEVRSEGKANGGGTFGVPCVQVYIGSYCG